jgi:hypothetical protein
MDQPQSIADGKLSSIKVQRATDHETESLAFQHFLAFDFCSSISGLYFDIVTGPVVTDVSTQNAFRLQSPVPI